jgi:tetratricopeptide (TPR) repeat protein/predicted Ser/Thr protein kinase
VACPDENVLMAMVEQALDPGQQHELEVHIDACESCRRVMAAAVGGRATAIGTPPGDTEPLAALVDVKIGERYVIDHLLGRGGMGAVYLARDLTLGREVALKLHRAGSGNDRLHREAIAMAKLAHPNVVTVFEIGTFEDRLYVAMEYVRGSTLRGWLEAAPRTWREVVDILLETGKGLAAAHAAGLVHRDFKPENVLVGKDGRPRVSDFGLARVDERPSNPIVPLVGTSSLDTPMTMTGALMGTPAYMAPEQLEGGTADARSDQFAFCVVAWECLFGKRPFAGATIAALALAVERQELQRPTRTEVPPRVREVIEHGLAVAPPARHADMPALLAKLRDVATPRAKRRIAIGAGVALAAGSAVAVAAVATSNSASVCAVGDDALAGAWDSPVRDKMRAAFVASGVKNGDAMFQRVAGALDDYAHGWVAMRRDACEATRVRGDQSESLLDLRMECLDHKRDELRALTGALAQADRPAVMGSVRAALGVGALYQCADAAALGAPVRPPDQQIRERVEAERSELAKVRAMRLLGQNKAALDKAEAIAARAKELNYRPLDAEALLVLGDLKDRTGDSASAIKLLEQCIVAADAGNHRLVAAEAWSNIAWIEGSVERKFERAEFAAHMAAAAIENLGGNDELALQLMNYEALILETKGQLEPAKKKYLDVIAAREAKHQQDSWQISMALNDLGGVERKLGDFAAARTHHERALAIRKRVFGDAHPYVFSSLNNLGNVAWSAKDYAQAETWFRAALAVGDDVFPPNHPQKALALANLASVYDNEHKPTEAVQTYRKALAMYEAVRGPDHDDVADTLHNLGTVLVQIGQFDEARRGYERALPILEKEHDDPALASLLYDIGDLYVRQRDWAHARPPLERALKLPNVNPKDKLEAEFALAKVLWETNERPRARELARTVQRELAGKDAEREVAQWIASHP